MRAPAGLLKLPTTLAYAKGGYSVALQLGSEGCRANVLLDTGSSSLAVTSVRYDPGRDTALSATALAQQITYGKGNWAGPVLRSRVGFGDCEQLRDVDNAVFAYVENAAADFFRDADGIWGMAYRHLDPAHDLSALLAAQGHDPALTWPWPYALADAQQQAAFHQTLDQQPRVELEPLFSALESQGVFADRFALQIGRAIVHVLDDEATAETLERDPLNRGTLVLGGGEECQDLYEGGFSDLRIVHDIYYNANLISLQVGDQSLLPAPALLPQYQANYASNAIIDTGSSFLMLEASLYDAVIDAFAVHDARLPGLVARFNEAYENEQGLPNAAIDEDDWPTLHLRLEAPDGSETCLRCEPSHYWQRNALHAGQSLFLLLRQVPGWPNQNVLGLPLLIGRYCIFDRRSGGSGRVRLAKARMRE